MDLGDFFSDMFNDDYWKGSDSTGSSNYQYYEATDDQGKTWTMYATASYSFSSYIPHYHVDIEKVLDRITIEEVEAVKKENYEKAAELRDKSKRIKANETLLKQLYDLKERAIKQGDYAYAVEVKERIQTIINGKENEEK
jgi:protein-arginine kinase activator protein McsA